MKPKKQTNKQSASESSRYESEEIVASDITTQIMCLMKDCFEGEISMKGEIILYRVPSGEKFCIVAGRIN